MIKVDKKLYKNLHKLFKELSWHLASQAVLSGYNPGELFVDSERNPTSAFMISPEGCYLAGNPQNEKFNQEMKNYFENQFLSSWKQNEFALIFLPEWEVAAYRIFTKNPLAKYKRFHYTIDMQEFSLDQQVDAKVKAIQPDFVENNLNLKNMQYVKIWIQHNWGSYENFEKNGFGSYILDDERVLSWSVCDCVFQDRCEIGIWADQDYRRMGLASKAVQANLLLAKKMGFREVGWHCSSDNFGSYKTAEKAGFKKQGEYFAYFGTIDKKT